MAGYPDANPRRTFSLRHIMVAMVGIALVFWLMFARDDETIRVALVAYVVFAVVFLVVMPMFLFRRTCPHCDTRSMSCLSVILLQPPLGSYFFCTRCHSQFQRRAFRQWIPREPLPRRLFPKRLGDPLVWVWDPHPPEAKKTPILFLEDPDA